MNTQGIYISTAITGGIAGVALGFVVILIATRDFYISFLASLSISAVIVSVTGCMFYLGWELGSIEGVCVMLLAGFSVDYIVHYAHSYADAVSTDGSMSKTLEAYKSIGTAIFSGMITSVLASIPLQLCLLQFFAKFGTFLLLTITLAWFWANFFFMPMLSIQDDLIDMFCRCQLWRKEGKNHEESNRDQQDSSMGNHIDEKCPPRAMNM